MPTPLEHLGFAYPYLMDGADTRYVPPDVLAWAISVSEANRPPCLSEEAQNLAQAHYAAYMLETRRLSSLLFSSTTGSTTTSGIVLEKQEGQSRIRYADPRSTGTTINTTGGNTPYAAWKALWDRCVGLVDVGTNPGGTYVPRGGIITRFGWPK